MRIKQMLSDTDPILPKAKPKAEQSRKAASPSDYFLKYIKHTKYI